MKSNIEWEKWGEHDPLFAVSSWQGKERGSPNAWTDAEFYELGRSDWADLLKHWRFYGVKTENCLEIGCGAGRMTKQLAEHFHRVTAVDVSQHQLDYARSRMSAANVTFTKSDGDRVPVAGAEFNAAFSTHVFQHFASYDDAFSIFREIHRALVDGGTLMIHLPLYELPRTKASKILAFIISFENRLLDIKAAIDRHKLRKGQWKPVMKFLNFNRGSLISVLKQIGFADIEFCMFAVRSNHDYHEFVLATKRARPAG
jgi:ubiquinone/menaquinone biosynthesis C-methylase UbiE